MQKDSKKEFTKSGSTFVGTITGEGVSSVPTAVAVSIANTTWTQWAIPYGVRQVHMRLREAQTLKIGTAASPGSNYFTLASGGTITFDDLFGRDTANSLYFQSGSGAANVEILYWTEGRVRNGSIV